VAFATKPQLAQRMIERAAAAGVPFAWVAGDAVYGDNGPLRAWLEVQGIAHVLAVACHHRVPAGAGRLLRADELAARLPRKAWQRLPAGAGAKGHRYYDWAWVTMPGPGHRCLLIRRNRATGELAFYRCYSTRPVTLAALVTVAGLRWTIEENFQAGKGLAGLWPAASVPAAWPAAPPCEATTTTPVGPSGTPEYRPAATQSPRPRIPRQNPRHATPEPSRIRPAPTSQPTISGETYQVR
jgi:hypothetical protein